MITNESEIRIALQAVIVSVLVLYGFWGCALVVLVILLPWKPLFAVGSTWPNPSSIGVSERRESVTKRGSRRSSRNWMTFLRVPKNVPRTTSPVPVARQHPRQGPPITDAQPLKAFHAIRSSGPIPQEMAASAQDLAASLAIPPAIESHVRNLPGAFSNMDLEIERVEFHGDSAEAYVRFHSPNVRELLIRQRYVLRKSGEKWEVESRQPANGSSHVSPPALPAVRQGMRLS